MTGLEGFRSSEEVEFGELGGDLGSLFGGRPMFGRKFNGALAGPARKQREDVAKVGPRL